MKGKIFFLMISSLLLWSCAEPKEEVIDMNEIIPKSERYAEDETQEAEDDTVQGLFDVGIAKRIGLTVSKVSVSEETMFPDRFNPRSQTKLLINDDQTTIFWGQWVYKDSLKTMNALFNWMDCFGEKCKSVKYLESANFQFDAMLLFVNDTSITYISTDQKLDENQWQKYLEEKYDLDQWDVVVVQRKQRKASWLTYGVDPLTGKSKFSPISK